MASPENQLDVRTSGNSRGTKRNFKEYQGKSGNETKMELDQPGRVSPFMPMFEGFRAELDEHHDRRERIIKATRDITALSKKQIFALQRARSLGEFEPAIMKDVSQYDEQIKSKFTSILPDLQGLNSWRYRRNITGAIQEFLEAQSFGYYIKYERLLEFRTAEECFPKGILLTPEDYILGLFDLTGEMMRFAITTLATMGGLPTFKDATSQNGARNLLSDMQEIRASFEALDMTAFGGGAIGKDVQKKMEVMRTCVEKVESAVYGMKVRGRERPKGWVPPMSDDRMPED
ncbi:Translin family-domain-containing protein [Xylogone sp. PMI_703]|nr:Translin family-domain-containing protein [Xylogone sp. PMI_703]